MFVRLLLAFVGFGVLAAALAGGLHQLGPVPALLIVAALAVAPAWYFARRLGSPFRKVADAADRVADGEYAVRLDPGPWAECRHLAGRFNQMVQQVAGRVGGLEAEREQLRAVLGGMAEGVIAVGAG
jgi:nitrogen fixation/metabolism regulation signal transduction histidine kinase